MAPAQVRCGRGRSNGRSKDTGRDRRLDELAKVEFTGSLGEAFGRYAWVLRAVSTRWDTELSLASADAKAALTALQSGGSKAKKVARRLRRAQTLAAGLAKRAEWLPKEYAMQFLSSAEAANRVIERGER
jgi:hypothetical protein